MKKIAAMALVGLSLAGCASLFGNNNRNVTVTSTPAGATVYYNGQNVGTTPANFQIESPWGVNSVRLEKEGYEPSLQQVQTGFQPVGILNIFFWPGFLVDAVTGDMMKIKNPNIFSPLKPVATAEEKSSKENVAASDTHTRDSK